MRGLCEQQLDDRGQPVARTLIGFDIALGGGGARTGELGQGARHVGNRQDVVHHAGFDGAARHAVEGGFREGLRDDQSLCVVDGLQAEAAIAAGAGQHHAGGARARIGGQRIEQVVEGQPGTVAGVGLRQQQGIRPDR